MKSRSQWNILASIQPSIEIGSICSVYGLSVDFYFKVNGRILVWFLVCIYTYQIFKIIV